MAVEPGAEYNAKVIEMIGDVKQFHLDMEEFRKDGRALDAQWTEVVEKYDEQWIGFYRGRVVAHDRDIHAVVEGIRAAGIPPGDSIVRYVSSKPMRMIL